MLTVSTAVRTGCSSWRGRPCVVSFTSSVGLITGSADLIHACVWCSLIDRRTKAAAFCSRPNVYSWRSLHAPIVHVSSNCWSCVREVDGVEASHLHLQNLWTFYPLRAFITISLQWCAKTETGYLVLKTEPNRTEFEKFKPTQPYHLWRHNLGSRWNLQKMAGENFSIGALYNITKYQHNPIKTVGRDSFLSPKNP